MAKWFFIDKGVKSGPFSDVEFFAHLKDKDPSRVQIWRQGMSAWVPADNIPQLVELMAPGSGARGPGRFNAIARLPKLPVRILVIAGVIAFAGIGAMIGVSHFQNADPTEVLKAPPQNEAPAAVPEPQQPAPPQPSRLSRDDFADAMRQSMSLLNSLQARFPKQYDDLVSEFYEKISNGEPEAETAIAMRRKAFSMVKALLPLADDDVLIALNKVVAEKYRLLNQKNPSLCYSFGSGADSGDISSAFPDDLLRRERDLYELAIKTAAPRSAPDPKKIGSLQGSLRRALLASGITESQFSLLDAARIEPAQHAQYCEVTILLFQEIGKLPPEDAAMVMRLLMSGK